jgi:hypothetical protein
MSHGRTHSRPHKVLHITNKLGPGALALDAGWLL